MRLVDWIGASAGAAVFALMGAVAVSYYAPGPKRTSITDYAISPSVVSPGQTVTLSGVLRDRRRDCIVDRMRQIQTSDGRITLYAEREALQPGPPPMAVIREDGSLYVEVSISLPNDMPPGPAAIRSSSAYECPDSQDFIARSEWAEFTVR